MVGLPAMRLRSDIERKRMHGLGETEQSGSGVGRGLYSADERAAVYERLADLAKSVLKSGHNVIVDASFLERDARARFHNLAEQAGAGFVIVSATASRDELQRRLAGRKRAGADASEADLAVLNYQLAHADAIDADERVYLVEVATDEPVDLDNVTQQCFSTASTRR